MPPVCPKCKEGTVLPGDPLGQILDDFHGAYFTPAPEQGETRSDRSKHTVLLLTDGFGLPLKNCKIMADQLAQRLNCDVWVPDYFNGEPLIPVEGMILPSRASDKLSAWQWIRLIFTVFLPRIGAFYRNRSSVTDARLKSFIQLIKEKKGYEKIGTVGYCFGGTTCVRFAGTDLVNSVVIAHPGSFNLDEVKAIKVPAAWICAEVDHFFPDSLKDQSEAHLESRRGKENFVEFEFKVYKGTTHGFASRPNLALADIKEAYEEAFEQAVEWFERTLFP